MLMSKFGWGCQVRSTQLQGIMASWGLLRLGGCDSCRFECPWGLYPWLRTHDSELRFLSVVYRATLGCTALPTTP